MPQRRLPNIDRPEKLIPGLKLWQRKLGESLKVPFASRQVENFQAFGVLNGVELSWHRVPGADGYEILRSETTDFDESVTEVIPIRRPQQTTYSDGLNGNGITRYYKIRATSGTAAQPHSVKGQISGLLRITSGSGEVVGGGGAEGARGSFAGETPHYAFRPGARIRRGAPL